MTIERKNGIPLRPEILAPAGTWESLRAAAAAGADAVYFGGKCFNARANAANFDDEAMAEAIGFCHARGMRAYITLNTTLFERELPEALDFVALLCRSGADAVIVQDPGLAALIREAAPSLRLHASTQMSVHSTEGVKALAEMGFSRVVVARELSRGELDELVRNAPIEIEVFVHGALCMSVSGQCYLSAMIGGRSGNRGMCAQPCRLPFRAPGGTGSDLSLKDLSLVTRIGDLSRMGVASLKIEGRMKRPEYVAAAVSACLHAEEGDLPPEELTRLRDVFSRGGLTQGYYEGKMGREMFGVRGKEDVDASKAALAGCRALYRAERARVAVKFEMKVGAGAPASLTAADTQGNRVSALGQAPEAARSKEITAEELRGHLSKTGGTPFYTREADVSVGAGLSLPAAAVNGMRREALEKLLARRSLPHPHPFAAPEFSTAREKHVENRRALRLRLRLPEQLTPGAEQCGAELVFLPLSFLAADPERTGDLLKKGIPLGAELPRAVFGAQREETARQLDAAAGAGIRDYLCGNLAGVWMVKEKGLNVHGDFSLNLANSYAVRAIGAAGARSAVLTPEATLPRLRDAAASGAVPCGAIAYGRLPLMLTRNCPMKNGDSGCGKCGRGRGERGGVRDRTGSLFPVVCFGGASELLNDRPLWMCDRKDALYGAGLGFAMLCFTVETPAETDEVLRAWHGGLAPQGNFTRGLYYRGVE